MNTNNPFSTTSFHNPPSTECHSSFVYPSAYTLATSFVCIGVWLAFDNKFGGVVGSSAGLACWVALSLPTTIAEDCDTILDDDPSVPISGEFTNYYNY